MLTARKQSGLCRVGDPGDAGSLSELIPEIPQKEMEMGIARDCNVEAGVGLGGGVAELCPSEVPEELDFLVMVVGEVNGLGARAIAKEGKG